MKFELTTNLVPFLNVGMYNTVLDMDEVFDYEIQATPEEDGEFELPTIEQYNKYILEQTKPYLAKFVEELKKFPFLSIVGGESVSIHSPKYYNYGTDELYFDIETSEDFDTILKNFLAYLEEKSETESFESFLKERYKSYDGFVSFMPQSISELLENDDSDRGMATILTYLMETQNLLPDNFQADFENDVYENRDDAFSTTETVSNSKLITTFGKFLTEKVKIKKSKKKNE